jgi:hypothetical protein
VRARACDYWWWRRDGSARERERETCALSCAPASHVIDTICALLHTHAHTHSRHHHDGAQASFFLAHDKASKGTYTLTVSSGDGASVTVPVWHAGAASVALPVPTELIVLGISMAAVKTAIKLA